MSNTSSFWFAGEDAQPDGPTIGQSLRFRGPEGGSPYLRGPVRPISSTEPGTLSMWIKFGNEKGQTKYLYGNRPGTSAGNPGYFFYWGNDKPSMVFSQNTYIMGPGEYRDYSAWYHVVLQARSDGTSLWINNQLVTNNFDPLPYYDNNLIFNWYGLLTGEGFPVTTQNSFEGYLADVHQIDGQALEPNAFGEFDENNVWVPREVDFTLAEMRYSDYVFDDTSTTAGSPNFDATGTTFLAGYDRTSIFDGKSTVADGNASQCLSSNPGGSVVMRFPPGVIKPETSLKVYTYSNAEVRIWVNEVEKTGTWTSSWLDLTPDITLGQSVTNITVQGISPVYGIISGLEVDGEILEDPYIWSTNLYTAARDGSTYSTTLEKDFRLPDQPASQAFDGVTTGGSRNSNAAETRDGFQTFIVYQPPAPITVNTSLRIYARNYQGNATYSINNGNEISMPAIGDGGDNTFGWADLNFTGELTSFGFHDNNSAAILFGIEIDGQILVDGVNSSYGANGFHLDFSDPHDIGADRSGNGNDFTATGFDTAPVGLWSTQCYRVPVASGPLNNPIPQQYLDLEPTTTDTTFNEPPSQGFDGEGAYAVLAGSGYTLFRPNVPIENVTSIICHQFTGQGNSLNGVDLGNTSDSNSFTTRVYDGAPITLETFGAFHRSGNPPNGGWWQLFVGINGGEPTVLVDNTGTDYDLMLDSPTQNYATLNPLDNHGGTTSFPTLSAANLQDDTTAASGLTGSTIHWNNENSEYYFEFVYTGSGNEASCAPGVRTAQSGQPATRTGANSFYYRSDGRIVNGAVINTGGADLANGASWTTGDVLGTAFNPSNNRLRFFKNGAEQCDITITPTEPLQFGVYNNGITGVTVNYGQKGNFLHQPAGTVALQTQNLPEADILNGRDHFRAITGLGQGADSGVPGQLAGNWSKDITIGINADSYWYEGGPATIFDGSTSTSAGVANPGSGGTSQKSFIYWNPEGGLDFTDKVEVWTNSLDGAVFIFNGGAEQDIASGDWRELASGGGTINNITVKNQLPNNSVAWWRAIKVDGKILVDGNILALAQQTFPNGLWWIKDRANSNQHQLVDSVRGGNLAQTCPQLQAEVAYAAPAGNSVAWCWNAGGPAVTNNDGSLESQVSANTDAGFSIVSYTGDTSSSQTIGHGLNQAPEFMIVNNRTAGTNYYCYHAALTTPNDQYLRLNTNENALSAGGVNGAWNNQSPDENVIHVGNTISSTNRDGEGMVAYCWHSIPGYSAFGSYTGNNDANGPFIYTGFRVSVLILKRTSGSAIDWEIYDTTRNPSNGSMATLYPSLTNAEDSGAAIDLLSNGFKLRDSGGGRNKGSDYVWAAFAENPFSYPANAR